MIKRSAISLILLAGFVILNSYFINKAREFCEIYPFDRIISGNILTNKVNCKTSPFEYKNQIIKIENEEINSKNIFNILSEFSLKKELKITVSDGDQRIIIKSINTALPNYDYLFFLICLLFFANIHYIWAFALYIVKPREIRSNLFSVSAVILSLFFYSSIDLFTYNKFTFGFPLIILLTGFLAILLGNNLTTGRINKYISGSIILFFLIYIIIYFIPGMAISYLHYGLFVYVIICTIYLTYYFISMIARFKKPAVIWRYSTAFFGICIGYLLPVSVIIAKIYTESEIPLYSFAVVSIIFPGIFGTSFFRYSQYDFYGYKIIQKSDIRLFLYSVLASIFISLLLFTTIRISGTGFVEKLYIAICIAIIIALLDTLHFINNIHKLTYDNKDQYAFSAQKIAEATSSPDLLKNKLSFIFNEIRSTTYAESLKLILFMEGNYEYYSELSEYIEAQPKNSAIYRFIHEKKEIILKYTLSKNSGIEGETYRFLRERNSIIIITIIEKEKIGILLIGKKSGGRNYSFADMHYLRSMANQAFQLIYNDWLHNDYLLKKQYESELDNASYVQMRLFPKVSLDRDSGMDISFFYRPYLRVIGDYFDFFKLDEDHTAIIIGDVSGHGLSTAMVLSAVNGITNAMLREVKAIENTCYEINNFLTNSYKGIELITLFIGIFNKKTRTLEYINAGHGAPFIIRKDEMTISQIQGRTKILGADPNAKYTTSSLSLNRNDELILYTDGVMEIYNEETGAGINEEDFTGIIYDNMWKSMDSKIIEIEKRIKIHSEAIRDDITIIGIKIL